MAILDGITMGGGAGISIPGTFRIATDKTVRMQHTHSNYNLFHMTTEKLSPKAEYLIKFGPCL